MIADVERLNEYEKELMEYGKNGKPTSKPTEQPAAPAPIPLLAVFADGRVTMAPGATLGQIIFAFNMLEAAKGSVRIGGVTNGKASE